MKTLDILNSKIKKIRIELPGYCFSHSSSGDSSQPFIGRERTREKLKKVIEDSPNEPGVYLIAGNRGVGKTSLVNKIINETSLQPNSKLAEHLRYLGLLLLAVIGTVFCLKKIDVFGKYFWGVMSIFIAFFVYLAIAFISMYVRFFRNKRREYKKMGLNRYDSFIKIIIWDSILNPINNYIQNYSRLYLRINFGHKLRDEKDILRLIVRTLSTEYTKYRRSFRRMLPWRALATAALLFLSYLFSSVVREQDIYKSIKKIVNVQELDTIINDQYRLKNLFSKVNTKVETKVSAKIENNATTDVDRVGEISHKQTEVNTNSAFTKFCVVLRGFDQIIKKFYPKISYTYWGLFFVMCLFTIIVFRSNWIMYLFVTHRIIMRRLKKLNEDITHSTEQENAVGVNSGSVGPKIGAKTKKSRSAADAREIEKRLQDILDDMQRIPPFMCRPKVVIVFDELDKVEPGDTNLEKETPQTKATMFSIGATRERQTEILRILSNLKYFLSSSCAKFIFIAGREMFDIHLADVSERNNYIGSIFNAVIQVPSFLADHPTGKKTIREESGIASLPEEFVCRKLIPHNYEVKSYNLKSYRAYLEKKIFSQDIQSTKQEEDTRHEKIEKIIAVLQQFIVYLAHVSKGAPKKMIQLFESFVEIRVEKERVKRGNTLIVRRNRKSKYFLTFNYYKQYTLGIIAYLITPIFYRLAESNIKEHSDKLLVSSLRFVDFLFKFHKHSFSWKHLDISPEMLEANRAPELKSVAVDLLNYLAQVHLTKSEFGLSDYKFDSLMANEIFALTKTDEVFSALFSFSLDETLPLKKHYQDLLEKTEREYQGNKDSSVFIDATSSLQVVLGDLCYYDDELEEAEVYYKNAVQALSRLEQKHYRNTEQPYEMVGKNGEKVIITYNNTEKEEEKMTIGQLYRYVRNMLRLGMIYEKRKQYDYAYLTYGGLCNWIIRERDISIKDLGAGVVLRKGRENDVFVEASIVGKVDKKDEMYYDNIKTPRIETEIVDSSTASPQPLHFEKLSPNTNDALFKKMTFEGLKMFYLAFIAKLQILELSHIGGIAVNHLDQLDREFDFLTYIIDHKDAARLEAEFYSRVADVLYYKNLDLRNLRCKVNEKEYPQNSSCTACDYYYRALSALLHLDIAKDQHKYSLREMLSKCDEQISGNYNMKYCTILGKILSDWGNIFFSCDRREHGREYNYCYICKTNCHINSTDNLDDILERYISYLELEKEDRMVLFFNVGMDYKFAKIEVAFAMYTISTEAFRKANLYKQSAYQIHKMLRLLKHYELSGNTESINNIKRLSEKAIHYLWHANEDLNVLELNKRKKDFDKSRIDKRIPLQGLLVDTEITQIRILVKELELKLELKKTSKDAAILKKYYELRITSPYKINYSVVGRIYRLRLKSKLNYEAYQLLLGEVEIDEELRRKEDFVLQEDEYKKLKGKCENTVKGILGIDIDVIGFLDNLFAETIYCLVDIIQLSETMGETYLFPHSFVGSVHEHLSFWIRQYESYETYKEKDSKIDGYLTKYLDEEGREQLSGYRENQQALSHYYKCLEMHNEGRAYHNMIDTMYYIRDDYNDRSDHFNIAEERHLIANEKIQKRIDTLKNLYKDSELYKVDNYFYKKYD